MIRIAPILPLLTTFAYAQPDMAIQATRETGALQTVPDWVCTGAIIIFVIFVTLVLINEYQSRKACEYVREKNDTLCRQFKDARERAQSRGVSEKSRRNLEGLAAQYDRLFSQKTACGGDWLNVREDVDALDLALRTITHDMCEEIAYAKNAQEQCPALFENVERLLKEVAGLFERSNPSRSARRHLEVANEEFGLAIEIRSGSTGWDPVVLNTLLRSVQSRIKNALLSANTAHSDTISPN